MLIYSQPPRSAADAAVGADRRATIAAYHKRTNPAPIADGWYRRWMFLVAGILVLDFPMLLVDLWLSVGHRRSVILENVGISLYLLGAAFWFIGSFAAIGDTVRRSWIAVRRRETTKADLRTVDLVAIQKLASGPDATKARASKLRRIRTWIGVGAGAGWSGIVLKALLDHGPHAELVAMMAWLPAHPALFDMSFIAVGTYVSAIVVSWQYVNAELALCVAAGANDD